MNNKKGYITLVSVLILISVLTVIVSVSIAINISTNSNARIQRDSLQSKAAADSCAEIALRNLKSSIAYSGNENITDTYGTCTIRPISGTGNTNRVIEIDGTYNSSRSKIRISVSQINPSFVITNWEYIADF